MNKTDEKYQAYVKLFLRFSCNDTCCGSCRNSFQMIRIRNDHTLYIFNDTSTGLNHNLIRKTS